VQIHFVGQGDDLLGASDDAQLAPLAPFSIHHDGTLHFCHINLFNALTSFEIGCKGTKTQAKCKRNRENIYLLSGFCELSFANRQKNGQIQSTYYHPNSGNH
jgi:hypothetical protein